MTVGRIGGLRTGQLVTLQVAALAVVATYPLTDWLFVPAVLLAGGALGAAFGRREGRWWYEDALLRRRLNRRRRHAARASTREHPWLAALAPSLAVREFPTRDTRLGVGLDDAGWYAVCAVRPGDSGTDPPVSLDSLVALLTGTDAPISALQVVHHAAASPLVHRRRPAVTVLPVREQTWVALRLATGDAPTAAASRGGGTEGVHRTLAAAAGAAGKGLRAAGLDYRVLAAPELVAALGTVAGVEAGEPAPAGQLPQERWDAWHHAGSAHVCFQLGGSAPRPLAELVAGLGRSAAWSFTVSALRKLPSTATAPTRGLLRIAAPADQLPAAASEVTDLAGRLGFTLDRLDGRHGCALYAAAPTARYLPT